MLAIFSLQIHYNIETIQLRFLRMLSERGSQNITFNCRNTLIDTSNHEIQLQTKNGMTYQMNSINNHSLQYNTIKDECKVVLNIGLVLPTDLFCCRLIMDKRLYPL